MTGDVRQAADPVRRDSLPAGRHGWWSRWAADLTLGARLAFAGGASGRLRLVLTGVGVGLGVALLLVMAAVPAAMQARHARTEARDDQQITDVQPPRGAGTVLIGTFDTTYHDMSIRGRLLRPEGPRAPLPPGVAAFPGPGQMVVSPALADLLASPRGALLRPRLNYRVVGTIGPPGLSGPHEHAFYAGSDRLTIGGGRTVTRLSSFGTDDPGQGLDPILLLLVVIGVVSVLAPIAVFLGTAVRHGGAARDRRLRQCGWSAPTGT